MTLNKVALSLVASLTLVMATTGVTHADTLTYSAAISSQPVPFSINFTLPKFDTTNGTLTGITISLSATSNANINVLNTTFINQPFTNATAAIPLTVIGPASTSIVATPTAVVASGTVPAAVGIIPGSFAQPGVVGVDNTSVILPSSAFASYEGVGSSFASFNAAATSGVYSGSARPGVFFGGSADVSGTTTIIYTYIRDAGAAPEPGSLALIGLGLLPLIGVMRRRRA